MCDKFYSLAIIAKKFNVTVYQLRIAVKNDELKYIKVGTKRNVVKVTIPDAIIYFENIKNNNGKKKSKDKNIDKLIVE